MADLWIWCKVVMRRAELSFGAGCVRTKVFLDKNVINRRNLKPKIKIFSLQQHSFLQFLFKPIIHRKNVYFNLFGVQAIDV